MLKTSGSAYLLNRIFESIFNLFGKEISKIIRTPTYIIICVYIFSCSIDEMIVHCCFSFDKIKKQNKTKQNKTKERIAQSRFLGILLETYFCINVFLLKSVLFVMFYYNSRSHIN